MKVLFKFIALVLITGNAYSQSIVRLDDNFNNNQNEWPQVNTQEVTSEITGGKYVIKSTKTSGTYLLWKDLFLYHNKDYTIEASIAQTTGADHLPYGIIWGSEDGDNHLFFGISGKGKYIIYSYRGGQYEEIRGWTIATGGAIKGTGTANILKLEQKNGRLNFYINDQRLFLMLKPPLFTGNRLGFLVTETMDVEVDYLKVTAPPAPMNLVENAVQGYKKENLGLNINSKYGDLKPIISQDDKTLYFLRGDHPDNVGVEKRQDAWVSHRDTAGNWGPAKNMGFPINNAGHNSIISVSPDGNTLLITNTYHEDGDAMGQGVSITNRTKTGWEVPKKINIKNYYNHNRYVNYCLTPGGNVMVMAVERDDTYGGLDLYVSFLQPDGSWSEPQNMGTGLNTYASDFGPFVAADNKTMYYSTSGLPGYGSADIFVTRRLDDTWLNWSEPQNLGPEINSTEWDAYYTLPASGEYAYLSSSENSYGSTDIFRIKLTEAAKPEPVVLITGRVLNSKTGEPLGANITYKNIKTQEVAGTAISDPATGNYSIILPYGNVYSFLAQQNGFYSISQNVDLLQMNEYREIKRDLQLAPIEVGQVIRLNNIFFEVNSAELKSESAEELDRLIELLNQYPKMAIELGGHTDSDGNDDYNLKLSDERVQKVLQYLTSKKVDTERLKAKGYGEAKPIATNTTPEGKALNRRVEFTILAN